MADWERGREAALCEREAADYSEESINLWRLAWCPAQWKWFGDAGRYAENRTHHVGTLSSL